MNPFIGKSNKLNIIYAVFFFFFFFYFIQNILKYFHQLNSLLVIKQQRGRS